MRRITVDEVKAAYEKTGLKPVKDTPIFCLAIAAGFGCPLDALLIAGGHGSSTERCARRVAIELDLPSADYVNGFVDAVDSDDACVRDDSEDYDAGIEDGKQVALAIFAEGT
jgi:hypothetical protein